MSDERVTFASLRARRLTNASFTVPRDRCGLYAQMFRASQFDRAQSARIGCTSSPPERFRTF